MAIGCKLRLAEYAEISQRIRIQLMNLGSGLSGNEGHDQREVN
jgi:hypothetical protein